ncbi:hypothetical protein GBF38_017079 [Nibea albiflora]|uniref:Uncharacterized protein n=1 Tax=Nibea albiflora TaxID=240163 RepID=A0ACB7EFL4_NIBAL|nr:hypothetical protein GBF38_017079 [Nibea albiflora]
MFKCEHPLWDVEALPHSSAQICSSCRGDKSRSETWITAAAVTQLKLENNHSQHLALALQEEEVAGNKLAADCTGRERCKKPPNRISQLYKLQSQTEAELLRTKANTDTSGNPRQLSGQCPGVKEILGSAVIMVRL